MNGIYKNCAEFHFICITFMTPLPIGTAVVFHCFDTNGLIHQPYHEFHPVGNLHILGGDIGTPFMKALWKTRYMSGYRFVTFNEKILEATMQWVCEEKCQNTSLFRGSL